jgi:hypothetical protein
MNVDVKTLQDRLTALLERLAFERRPCKLCGETTYWLLTRDQHKLCLDADATPHRQTCRRAPLVAPVEKRGAGQSEMFQRDVRRQAFDPH